MATTFAMVGLLAILACSALSKRIEVAKLYYFDSDRDRLFRRMAEPRPSEATKIGKVSGRTPKAVRPQRRTR